jgi:hypothetical protein
MVWKEVANFSSERICRFNSGLLRFSLKVLIKYGRRPTRSNLVWPNFKDNDNIGNGRVGELAYPSVSKTEL